MVQTQLAGRVEIDEAKVLEELETAANFHFSEAYSEYLCGGPWKSCMLWASGGDSGDGLITNYEHSRKSSITKYGEQLPYLRQFVESNFNLENLNFARLAVISNSVTIPHRDLLELAEIPEDARNSHRVHVPLVTNENCFFTQDNIVYQMKVGEVWFFDASRVHGAASLSPEPRTHLILDFSDAGGNDLARFDLQPTRSIPEDRIHHREQLAENERESLLRLASVIDTDNFRDIFSIVIKMHYRKDGGDNFVWGALDEIGRTSKNEIVRSKILELHRYFLMERSA